MMKQSATGEDSTDTLARDLIRTALIPTKDLNITTINERFTASKKLSELVRVELSNFAQNLETDPKYEGMAVVSYLTSWANKIDSRFDSLYPTSLYAEQIAAGNTELDDKLMQFHLSYQKAAASRIVDLTIPSHLRITLTEMRPHLEAALAKHGEQAYGLVVDDTLTAMDAADIESAARASIILAVTDPSKLRSLTQVAAVEPRGGREQGAQGTGSALAERWTRLAGI
jgi:hypothetical protein